MGFTIAYRSTRPVGPEAAAAIRSAADLASLGRTWLGCEPVQFDEADPEGLGHLSGGSKPNFSPDPDDAASADEEGLPDGDVADLLDVLARLSRDHGVDWEIRHDHEPGPAGHIRGGVCDPGLLGLAEAFDGLSDLIGEYEDEVDPDDDDDDGPRILRFRADP